MWSPAVAVATVPLNRDLRFYRISRMSVKKPTVIATASVTVVERDCCSMPLPSEARLRWYSQNSVDLAGYETREVPNDL